MFYNTYGVINVIGLQINVPVSFRLSEKEKELERFRAGKLSEWKTAANNIQGWLKEQETDFESFGDLSNDLDELRVQKAEIEV